MINASRKAWASFLRENVRCLVNILGFNDFIVCYAVKSGGKNIELAIIRRNQLPQVCVNDFIGNKYITGIQNLLTKIIPGDICTFNLMYEISPSIWWYNVR